MNGLCLDGKFSILVPLLEVQGEIVSFLHMSKAGSERVYARLNGER